MSVKEQFDDKIKELLISKSNYTDADFFQNEHENYFKNKTFKKFVDELLDDPVSRKAYGSIDGGMGGELKPHKNAPPKMASVASSSRFIYLLFKDRTALKEFVKSDGSFELEKRGNIKLSSKAYTTPNYDGYFESNKEIVYFEAKCHEVFDCHYAEWRIKYKELFNKIECIKKYIVPYKESRKYKSYQKFKLKHPDKLDKRKRYEYISDQDYIELCLCGFGLKPSETKKLYFDVKQLVCHLLGMAERDNKIKAKLIYLYYCPKSIKEDETFAPIYSELEKQFYKIKDSKIIKYLLGQANATLEFRYSTNETMEMKPNISNPI